MKSRDYFGEEVDGYTIRVLNEREIRAASGILFLFAFVSLLMIIFRGNFLLAKYFVVAFLLDFSMRLFITPRLSPTLVLGRLIVSNQTPEYVGAPQKRFAWWIGWVLSFVMFVLMVWVNSYSVITGLICLICLLFLFFESSFGICLGCLFYGWVYRDKAQYCPGEICDVKDKQAIQRVSVLQIMVLVGFIGAVVIMAMLFNDAFSVRPTNLWDFLSELHQ